MVLLRGYLNVSLNEAKDLPDCDTVFFNFDSKDTSDPFAEIQLGSSIICKTAFINNNLCPKWMESFKIPICHETESLIVKVLDKDHFSAGKLGELELRTQDLLDGTIFEGWYPLSGCDGQINLRIEFISKDIIDTTFEVPDTYFTIREDCNITLYQDAHCPVLSVFDNVPVVNEEIYLPNCAWTDLYNALMSAQKLIYITGWSVYTSTILVRTSDDSEEGVNVSIGEILKMKAEEGVRVLILIWNEKLSTEVTPGLMSTHDEETKTYFEDTNVEVVVVPRLRNLEGVVSFFQEQFAQTCYSHHQKSVILDAPGKNDKPKIIAFVGGLDITDGRWDTPEHMLFRTLKSEHNGDFYNGCASTTEEYGPRQPWHDIHCKVEGLLALDILCNFTERWRCQVSERESRLLPITNDEFAIDVVSCAAEEFSWHGQLFRSITSDSAIFDFDRIYTVPKRKGKYIDDSIHRAYIHHIRRADKFLYIENQYFLGSSYGWDEEQSTKAHHLIPQEIAQKIVEKIYAGEHFAAYVIVPMFPEGDPHSKPVQEILHWQHRTMEMMYKAVSKAIEENSLDTHPTDYLGFYCLGKGEAQDEIPEDLPIPDCEMPSYKLREQARFMIYVHSKMMIVDDDYIIIGSANINQRSMGGTRDSEIAIGAYQPSHTREATNGEPRGHIHQFRMSLWAEHLGFLSDIHIDPSSIDCVRAVNEVAFTNWANYSTNEPCHLDGHLLKYPLQVNEDGSVTPYEDCLNFPDTEAPVIGAVSFLPSKLTT